MWGAMLQNIDQNNLELSKIVSKSVANLAPTCQAYFSDQTKRDAIMKALFELLTIQNSEIRAKILHALIQIVQ